MTWKTILRRALLTLIFLLIGALEIGQARYLRLVLANPYPPAGAANRFAAHRGPALPKPIHNPCG
jgi:hypothetical protein